MIYLILFLSAIGAVIVLEKKGVWRWFNRKNPFTFFGWLCVWMVVMALICGILFLFEMRGFLG